MMQANDPEVQAKKKRIKLEMILKDSDFKKNARLLSELEMQTRNLNKKKIMIETELHKIEAEAKKIQGMQVMLQTEMKKLKNNLTMLQ